MLCFITFSEGDKFRPIEVPDNMTPKAIVSLLKKKTKTFIILFPSGQVYDAVLHSLQASTEDWSFRSGWRKRIEGIIGKNWDLFYLDWASEVELEARLRERSVPRHLMKWLPTLQHEDIEHVERVILNNMHKGVVRGIFPGKCAYCRHGYCRT